MSPSVAWVGHERAGASCPSRQPLVLGRCLCPLQEGGTSGQRCWAKNRSTCTLEGACPVCRRLWPGRGRVGRETQRPR